MVSDGEISRLYIGGFRPLSRGLFFNLIPISRQRRETQRHFRPLSWGLFFNRLIIILLSLGMICFRPLSRGLFFNCLYSQAQPLWAVSFRPLSWGLSFNHFVRSFIIAPIVFVPFLGDFLSMASMVFTSLNTAGFSSPFLGTFFQLFHGMKTTATVPSFRPLSWGLSFNESLGAYEDKCNCFRPLSWGLSFNKILFVAC